ncbi:MAG TPA: PEP-CTERM sorting domain-containing protein [Candidatus Eisenbacteria bacterium]|nr:PEP-CTERM sorting domain-containing protein [Candidatus Eisenbacteria bacterium]
MKISVSSIRLVLAIMAVIATMATAASAQQLIGTYTIDYYYNAVGCMDGFPNSPPSNPFYCTYIPPGPVVIPASPGPYRATVSVAPGLTFYSAGVIWNGDANSGSSMLLPTTPGASVDFNHTGADIVFYYWDWYPWDNSPSWGEQIQLYRENTPEPGTLMMFGTGLLALVGAFRRKLF